MVPDLAPIMVVPTATAVARPDALMVANCGIEELQNTKLVMSCCGPLVKVPVAVNCCVWGGGPNRMEAVSGVIAIETRPTVRPVLPVMVVPEAAWIVVPPNARPVAKPVASIVAIAAAEELQPTNGVMFSCDPPMKVPVAVNCCVPLTTGIAG